MRDKLLAIGVILDDEELLHIAIKVLPKEYNAFRFAICTRSIQLIFDELATMLNAKEESLNEGLKIKDPTFAMVMSSNQRPNSSNNYNQSYNQPYNSSRGRNNNNSNREGRGRGSPSQTNQFSNQCNHFSRNQSSSSRFKRPTCQICGKLSHLAIDCYHRMDYAYQGKHPPTKLATMVTTSNACITQDQHWFADNAATDHVIASLDQLGFP